MEAYLSECEIVKKRILDKWEQVKTKGECEIIFEMDSIGDFEQN